MGYIFILIYLHQPHSKVAFCFALVDDDVHVDICVDLPFGLGLLPKITVDLVTEVITVFHTL